MDDASPAPGGDTQTAGDADALLERDDLTRAVVFGSEGG